MSSRCDRRLERSAPAPGGRAGRVLGLAVDPGRRGVSAASTIRLWSSLRPYARPTRRSTCPSFSRPCSACPPARATRAGLARRAATVLGAAVGGGGRDSISRSAETRGGGQGQPLRPRLHGGSSYLPCRGQLRRRISLVLDIQWTTPRCWDLPSTIHHCSRPGPMLTY